MSAGKKIAVGILLIIVVAILFFLFRYIINKKSDPYATFIAPRLEFSEFEIREITKEQTHLFMLLSIDNPSPFGIHMDSLTYKFYIGGVEVMHSTYPKSVDIDAIDSGSILLPVVVNNRDLINILKKLENNSVDSVIYRVESEMYLNLPFLKNKPQKIVTERYLPVFILPEVKITDIDIGKLSMNASFVTTTISIVNENDFSVSMKEIYYKFSLKGEPISYGTLKDTITLKALDTTVITIPFKIETGDLLADIPALFFNKDDTEYDLYSEFLIVAEPNAIRDSKVVLTSKGMVKELTDLRKK